MALKSQAGDGHSTPAIIFQCTYQSKISWLLTRHPVEPREKWAERIGSNSEFREFSNLSSLQLSKAVDILRKLKSTAACCRLIQCTTVLYWGLDFFSHLVRVSYHYKQLERLLFDMTRHMLSPQIGAKPPNVLPTPPSPSTFSHSCFYLDLTAPMLAVPQVPTPAPTASTQRQVKVKYPPRAGDQDLSRRVMIHYPEDVLIPDSIWEAREMLSHYPEDEPIASTHYAWETESILGILKPARPVEPPLNSQFPAIPLRTELVSPDPHEDNTRKRSRESEDEEADEDDRGPRRYGKFPAPPRPSKRPRFATYALSASRVDVLRSSFVCEVAPVRTKRSRNALEDKGDSERMMRGRPPPTFSGSQVINGRICADSVGEIRTKREQEWTLRFAPLRTDDMVFLVGRRFADPPSRIASEKATKKDAAIARLTNPLLQAEEMNRKYRKWFSWMVNRRTTEVTARRDNFLGRRLDLAHTPAEIRIAQTEMEAYEKRFESTVKAPKKAEAVAFTGETIALLWAEEPVLVLGSASNTTPELPLEEDTPMTDAAPLEQYEEPPFEPMPGAPPPSPEWNGSNTTEHAAPLDNPGNAEAGPSSQASSVSILVVPNPLPPSLDPPAPDKTPREAIGPHESPRCL